MSAAKSKQQTEQKRAPGTAPGSAKPKKPEIMDVDADGEPDVDAGSASKSSASGGSSANAAKNSGSSAQAEMEAEEDVYPSKKIGSHLSRNYDEKTSRQPGYICGGEGVSRLRCPAVFVC